MLWRIFILFLILYIFLVSLNISAAKNKICDPSYCNHEGECVYSWGSKKCNCFDGGRYFGGKFCNHRSNPCVRGACPKGTCKAGIGQFTCQACPPGTSGQRCEQNSDKFFRSFMFLSNRYVFYGQQLPYIMAFKCVGIEPIHVELRVNDIKVDVFYINRPNIIGKTVFRYCQSVPYMAELAGIRNIKHLFKSGYYFSSCLLLYAVGEHRVTVKIFETKNNRNLHSDTFKIRVLKNSSDPCLFNVDVLQGKYPEKPIPVRLDRAVHLQPIVRSPCFRHSDHSFRVAVYDKDSKKMVTPWAQSETNHRLFIQPYTMMLQCEEFREGHYVARIEVLEDNGQKPFYRKLVNIYVKVVRMRISAKIGGGTVRTVGENQKFFLDGRKSRNWCYSKHANQALYYKWTCLSPNDPENVYCKSLNSTAALLELHSKDFRWKGFYTFELTVTSQFNPNRYNSVKQTVQIVKGKTLDVVLLEGTRILYREYLPGKLLNLRPICIMPICYGYKEIQDDYLEYAWQVLPFQTFKFDDNVNDNNPPKPLSSGNALQSSNAARLAFFNREPKQYTVKLKMKHKTQDASVESYYHLYPLLLAHLDTCYSNTQTGIEATTVFHISCTVRSGIHPFKFIVYFGAHLIGIFDEHTTEKTELKLRVPWGWQQLGVSVCDSYTVCSDRFEIYLRTEPYDVYYPDRNVALRRANLKFNLDAGDPTEGLLIINCLMRISSFREIQRIFDDLDCFEIGTMNDLSLILLIFDTYLYYAGPVRLKQAIIMQSLLSKINSGLEWLYIRNSDNDLIRYIHQPMLTAVYSVLSKISKPCELILASLKISSDSVQIDDMLSESYGKLPAILPQLRDRPLFWRRLFEESMTTIERTLALFVMEGYYLPFYAEDIWASFENVLYFKLFHQEGFKGLRYNAFDAKISISGTISKFVQCQMKSNIIYTQLLVFKEDPFWWVPRTRIIDTNVVAIQFMERFGRIVRKVKRTEISKSGIIITLKYAVKLNENIPGNLKNGEDDEVKRKYKPIVEYTHQKSKGTLNSFDERVIHYYRVQAHEFTQIKFNLATQKLRILIEKRTKPSIYNLKRSKQILDVVQESNPRGRIINIPGEDYNFEKIEIYIAIMAAAPFSERISYSFNVYTFECLSMDIVENNLDWSAENCHTTSVTDTHIQCSCLNAHFVAGNKLSKRVRVVNDDKKYLDYLPNYVIGTYCYLILYGILLLIIVTVYYRRRKYNEIIIVDQAAPSLNEGFAIYITTGHSPNSGTTSNMILRFHTKKEIYKAKIFQDPDHLYFQNSTTTLVHISSQRLATPFTLELQIDITGRYPSWFCESIKLIDLHDKNVYNFRVLNWITKAVYKVDPTENQTPASHATLQLWAHYFMETFVNWFKFQPIIGPWRYGINSMDAVQRTCVYISRLAVAFTVLIVLQGPTNYENYEVEHDAYANYKFDIPLLLRNFFFAYLASLMVPLIFHLLTYKH